MNIDPPAMPTSTSESRVEGKSPLIYYLSVVTANPSYACEEHPHNTEDQCVLPGKHHLMQGRNFG